MQAKCGVQACGKLGFGNRNAECKKCRYTWYFCKDHEPRPMCDCQVEKKRGRKESKEQPTKLSDQEKKLKTESPMPRCPSPQNALFPIEKDSKPSKWFAGSVGIEFQTPNIHLVNSEKRDDNVKSKVIVFKGEEKVFVESDCGELEIVTDPIEIPTLDGEAQTILHLLQRQFIVINKLIGKDGTFCSPKKSWILPEQKVGLYLKMAGSNVLSVCNFRKVSGRLQVSLSLELERIPQLLECDFVGGEWEVSSVQDEFPTLRERSAPAFGLICMCLLYKRTLATCLPKDKDGPKQNLTVLCRTDFHSMYNLLNKVGKECFLQAKTEIKKVAGNDLIFPNGYNIEGDVIGKASSITYGEWLDSIVEPLETCRAVEMRLRKSKELDGDETLNHKDQPKDLLSPPPFFECDPTNEFCYAMGKYGAYNGRIIIELRGLPGGMNGLSLERAWKETVKVISLLFEKEQTEK